MVQFVQRAEKSSKDSIFLKSAFELLEQTKIFHLI
jgi:hypothetical protein